MRPAARDSAEVWETVPAGETYLCRQKGLGPRSWGMHFREETAFMQLFP